MNTPTITKKLNQIKEFLEQNKPHGALDLTNNLLESLNNTNKNIKILYEQPPENIQE